MRFSVNGSDQGVAFRVAKSELAGRALFPHVLTKNQVINCPFCWSYCPFCWSYCPIPTWNPRIFTNMLINYWVGVEKTKNNDPWKFQFYNLLRTSLWTLAKCLVPFARLSRATPLLANWTLPMELSGYLRLKLQTIHYDSIHKSHLELCNDADHEMSQTGVRSHLLVELIVKPSWWSVCKRRISFFLMISRMITLSKNIPSNDR